MSNVIEFLERMGKDAQLRHATSTEARNLMNNMNIAAAVQTAIETKDQNSLETLLGANTNVCCMIQADFGDDFSSSNETYNKHATNRASTVA